MSLLLTTLGNGMQVSGPDGTDTLTTMEFLRFDDVTIPVSGGTALTGGSLGDFTGDGRSDILWRQPNGGIAEWQTDASGQLASTQALGSTSTAWRSEGFG